MNETQLRLLLNEVKTGARSLDDAITMLRTFPSENIGFARIDHQRPLRNGFPEVVFCEGKSAHQVIEIMTRLAAQNPRVMGTRASAELFDVVRAALPHARYFDSARIILMTSQALHAPPPDDPYILVVSAGTADIPIAEEAAVSTEILGSRVNRLYDVGVAGLHRLLEQRAILENANVIIAVAGMDGVLPTIIAGLVKCPVVAVPTSIGYGTGWGGAAAVLTMLNACAAGVAVVNIDNGFGAGFFAHQINQCNRVASAD